MFSVDFGTLSCEGYPWRLTRDAIVRPSDATWCLGVLFHRFVIDFGVHFGRHFRTCCIISGIQFQSVFFKASRDALVMIFGSVWGAFWEAFSTSFQEQVKSWFWWPIPCESYDLGVLGTPFSLLFHGLFHVAFLDGVFLSFWSIFGALETPFGCLWGHLTPFFPLPIFSRFLRCVFLTFGLPQGGPNACRRLGRGTLWDAGKTAFWLHN